MDTRFPVAVHLLVFLQLRGGVVGSDALARSTKTNPSRVRELIARLGKAGFTESVRGRHGGTCLNRRLADISLRDVYHAVYEDLPGLPMHEANEACPVGREMYLALFSPLQLAEASMRDALAETTVAQIAARVQRAQQVQRARRR